MEPARTSARPWWARLLVVGAVALGLAACAGPPQAQPSGDEEPVAEATELQPVPAETGAETPGKPQRPGVAFVPAGPGDGTIELQPGDTAACMYYHCGSDAPALGDGLTFQPTGVALSSDAWSVGGTTCGDAGLACLVVELSDPDTTCWMGFTRDDPADTSERVTATAQGEVRCIAPRPSSECEQIVAALVGGTGRSLEFPTPEGASELPPSESPSEASATPSDTPTEDSEG